MSRKLLAYCWRLLREADCEMEEKNRQLIKRIVLVYSMLALLFVAEFWVNSQADSPIDSKFVINNNLTPNFGLFVREYNLWKFANGTIAYR